MVDGKNATSSLGSGVPAVLASNVSIVLCSKAVLADCGERVNQLVTGVAIPIDA